MTSQKNTVKPLPAQACLRELLDYDPDTGVFRWLLPACNRAKIGEIAGSSRGRRYTQIGISGELFMAHRLAFVWMRGYCPEVIDHINGNGLDNRWSNLREATLQKNSANRRKHKTNKSGHKGVHWDVRDNRWRAMICIDGKNKSLGSFVVFDDAVNAYKAAAVQQFGEFANFDR